MAFLLWKSLRRAVARVRSPPDSVIVAQAFDRFVFDLDGVVWIDHMAVPGAPETIRSLREAGKRIAFVTNNSTQTPVSVAKKLADIGARGDPSDVVTSTDAVAALMPSIMSTARERSAFVIGESTLIDRVSSLGIRISDGDDPVACGVVVVGQDGELTYEKLRRATLAIRAGAAFVAANTDATYPGPDGLWPGCGAIVAALRVSTGVDPIVAGKPQPMMLETAAQRLKGSPALVVGDRIETDILGAQAIGWPNALVLTGATRVVDLATAPSWPDFVLRRLPDLLADLPHPRFRRATGADLPSIALLLHEGGLPVGAARDSLSRTVVAQSDHRIIATAAWEQEANYAVLSSVSVANEARASGTGRLIVAAVLRHMSLAGVRTVFLTTTNGVDFFSRCGFSVVATADLPEAVPRNRPGGRGPGEFGSVMRLILPGLTSPPGADGYAAVASDASRAPFMRRLRTRDVGPGVAFLSSAPDQGLPSLSDRIEGARDQYTIGFSCL